MELEVSKEQFEEWRHHPVTVAVFTCLELQEREAQQLWLNGEYLKDRIYEAGTMGRLQGYRAIREMTFQEMAGILHDE